MSHRIISLMEKLKNINLRLLVNDTIIMELKWLR